MIEYAYFEEIAKGNSREMVEAIRKIKKFFDSGIITEFAYSSGSKSFFAIREPIFVAVKVEGDIGEAKFQALKLLKNLGYVKKEVYDFEELFKFAEKLEHMSVEELIKEIKKLTQEL
ncbi:MAG: hypothetical protein QXM23_04615 [Archaeoglobaceae archaeon]|uniref:Uncharacterized protein n=1 Tax=Archaeoglobus fulgidus TaxID=2234 RepID=A0A7J3M534_ARCFL